MDNQEKNVPEVKFLTSLAMAVSDLNDEVKHVQIVVAQSLEDGKLVCYFDVVDPSKIKLQDDSVRESN